MKWWLWLTTCVSIITRYSMSHDGRLIAHSERMQRMSITLKQSVFTDSYSQCGNCGGVWGVKPPLNVFNPLVAFVYLFWGSDVTPTDRKNVKNTKFSCQRKGFLKLKMHQNPFSAGAPAGRAYDAPPDPLDTPFSFLSHRRLRRFALSAFLSHLTPTGYFPHCV